jgi:hypothetical protein
MREGFLLILLATSASVNVLLLVLCFGWHRLTGQIMDRRDQWARIAIDAVERKHAPS